MTPIFAQPGQESMFVVIFPMIFVMLVLPVLSISCLSLAMVRAYAHRPSDPGATPPRGRAGRWFVLDVVLPISLAIPAACGVGGVSVSQNRNLLILYVVIHSALVALCLVYSAASSPRARTSPYAFSFRVARTYVRSFTLSGAVLFSLLCLAMVVMTMAVNRRGY